MPKKTFYTKEYIVNVAVQIVRESGIDSLSAREVAKRTGCSVCPIFSAFDNMDGLHDSVVEAVRRIYDKYIAEALKNENAFKSVGEAYIKFAVNEPKFFQLLFMNDDNIRSLENVLPSIDGNYDKILQSVINQYGTSREIAFKLYKNMWVFTHGIAAMCATRTCNFSESEISAMETDVFTSLLVKYKREEK